MKKKPVVSAIVILLAIAGLVWALLPKQDPQVAKVQQLQEKLANTDLEKATPQERRQMFTELRQETDKLTPEQREEMRSQGPPPAFARQMQRRMDEFNQLPEDKKKEALDKMIDEMEARRKEWEKRRAEGGGQAGGQRGPGGPGRNWGNMDPAQRQAMQKKMLDRTTPEQRAQGADFFRQLQQRRQERGLPPMQFPR